MFGREVYLETDTELLHIGTYYARANEKPGFMLNADLRSVLKDGLKGTVIDNTLHKLTVSEIHQLLADVAAPTALYAGEADKGIGVNVNVVEESPKAGIKHYFDDLED